MKCEKSVWETSERWQKLGQYVWNQREWRESERKREMEKVWEEEGGQQRCGDGRRRRGRDEPPVLSCQCFLCRWGRRSAKSLSPTHTDTHASLYNGCFTLVPERERVRQREGDMVRRRKKERHGGEGGWVLEKERKKETAMRNREKGAGGKCLWDWGSADQTDRETDISIKSLYQSGEETDETVWEQYDAAIGLIDLKPNRIKQWRAAAPSPIPHGRLSLSIRRCMSAPLTVIYQEWFIYGIYLN